MLPRSILFVVCGSLAALVTALWTSGPARAQCSTITGPGMPSGGPCPQQRHYSAPSGGSVHYSGGGGGGGGYNYGAAIGAAGAAIEAAPAAINVLSGILSTGADIASGVAATGGQMIDSGAETLSNAATPSPGLSGPSLPNPFKLLNPENADAADDVPDCLRKAHFAGGHQRYRPVNACAEPVIFTFQTSERSYENDVRNGNLVFTTDRQTVRTNGAGEAVWSIGGRPVLLSVCNNKGQCYHPSNNNAAAASAGGNAAPSSASRQQPRKQKVAEVKKPAAKPKEPEDSPLDKTIFDILRAMPGSSIPK